MTGGEPGEHADPKASPDRRAELILAIHRAALELRAHPELWTAIRSTAAASLAQYTSASRQLRHVAKDRGGAMLCYAILAEHGEHPGGIPAANIRRRLNRIGAASRGRIDTLLDYMLQHRLIQAVLIDGQRFIVPGAALEAYFRGLAIAAEEALKSTWPAAYAPHRLRDDSFMRAYWIEFDAIGRAVFSGFTGEPKGFSLLWERNAGAYLAYALFGTVSGERAEGEGRLSVSGLSKQLGVSRPHILKMLRDAAGAGQLEWDAERRRVRLTPDFVRDYVDFASGVLAIHRVQMQAAEARIKADAATQNGLLPKAQYRRAERATTAS